MLSMILSAADPDWEVAEDWAPMPDMKDETPSQVSMYSDDESGVPELHGIIVNTKDLRGQIYVAPEESLTLTTVDDDETLMSHSDSEDGVSDEGSDSTDELPEDYDVHYELDKSNTNQDRQVGQGEQVDGTRNLIVDKDNETMTESQEQPQQSSFLENYAITGEELQKVSELAKSATDRATEAGKQISSLLLDGLHMGMAGMVKHLESIEQAVQNQMEQTQAAETRDQQTTSRGRATAPASSKSKSANSPAVLVKQNTFEQSTVSSMGDTFREYFKSRLLQQRRLQQQKQQRRANDDPNRPATSKANEKRIIDFGEVGEKLVATDTKKNTSSTKVVNSQQPKSAMSKNKTADTKIASHSTRKRSISRGRERSFPRPSSKVETRSPAPSRREGRSRSCKREGTSRSRSRPRERSISRKEEVDAKKKETNRRSVVEKKPTNATIKHDDPKLTTRQALERGRSTTQKVIQAPRGKTETAITKKAAQRPLARGVADTAGRKNRVRSTSSRPPPERKSEEGLEMVPFTAKSGASGLLIINSGHCNLSTTPRAIRDTLEGKTSSPVKNSTTGQSKTPQQTKQAVKSSLWSLRKESNAASNRRNGASNRNAGKVMLVDSRKKGKSVSGSSKRIMEPTPENLDDMVDAITKFRLTAKKLGVAEDDLLEAMSFATQQGEGDR